MDSSNRPSPRSLQGPRPTPLKVRKDSYKINKKPPTIPNNSNPPPPHPPPRPPVIIYTVSPKIIHTNPSDFMTLVQKLTGPNPHSVDSPSIANFTNSTSSALSPAARFAAIEKEADRSSKHSLNDASNYVEGVADDCSGMLLDRPNSIPGILSPLPSSLQPISSSFFSPITSFDPGSLSFLNDLSPGFAAAGGGGGNFLISPSNLLSASTMMSPGSCWDFLNQFDL